MVFCKPLLARLLALLSAARAFCNSLLARRRTKNLLILQDRAFYQQPGSFYQVLVIHQVSMIPSHRKALQLQQYISARISKTKIRDVKVCDFNSHFGHRQNYHFYQNLLGSVTKSYAYIQSVQAYPLTNDCTKTMFLSCFFAWRNRLKVL